MASEECGGRSMSGFTLTPVSTLTSSQPQNTWLIKNFMEAASLGMLFGAPASAKSFLAMDIAFCIANNIDWSGKKTKQGTVIYLAGEGFSGMAKRFKALETKYGTVTQNIHISQEPANMLSRDHLDAVYDAIVTTCTNPALIVVDTLHRNFGDGDENSAKDLGIFINHLSALRNATGAAILLVHHSGHGASERARGSSAIRAAMDTEYKVEKSESSVTLKCTKAKEFNAPEPASFDLEPIILPGWCDD